MTTKKEVNAKVKKEIKKHREGKAIQAKAKKVAQKRSAKNTKQRFKDATRKVGKEQEPKTLKKRFERAVASGDMAKAKEILLQIFKSTRPMYSHSDFCSLFIKNELKNFTFKYLGDGKVAIGRIYENRSWISENFILGGGGIQWHWMADAALINLTDDGFDLIASCESASVKVRHELDHKLDLWNKLDNEFLEIDPETGILTVGLKMDKKHGGEWVTKATIDIEKAFAKHGHTIKFVKTKQPKENSYGLAGQKIPKLYGSPAWRKSVMNIIINPDNKVFSKTDTDGVHQIVMSPDGDILFETCCNTPEGTYWVKVGGKEVKLDSREDFDSVYMLFYVVSGTRRDRDSQR